MSIYRNTLIATVLSLCALTSQASEIFTLQASGTLKSGYDEGGFFGPANTSYVNNPFVHTIKVDLDSCATSFSSLACYMTSSLTVNGTTVVGPPGIGSFSVSSNHVSAYLQEGFQVGVMSYSVDAIISGALSSPLPQDWANVTNFVSLAQNGDANASFDYYENFIDPPSQKYFWAETDYDQLIINPVPEPSSIALIGLASAGLAFARRRKSKN